MVLVLSVGFLSLPWVPSSEIEAVLLMMFRPAGTLGLIVIANTAEPVAPLAESPIWNVY